MIARNNPATQESSHVPMPEGWNMMRAARMLWHGFLVLYAALYLLGIFLVRTFTANDKLALSLAAALSVILVLVLIQAT